ncbi:hypothetical protein ACFL1S_06230 [Pseudomonadota bacterium]
MVDVISLTLAQQRIDRTRHLFRHRHSGNVHTAPLHHFFGPAGTGFHDLDNRRLNRTPSIFTDLENALYDLSRENLAVVWARYVLFPKPHAVTRNGEQIVGYAARLAFVNDNIRPHQMTRAQYGDRLTRIKGNLSRALNLSQR